MLPLQNRRILITRPRGQSSSLATLLQARGATPILIPTIEIAPPSSYCALDASLAALRSFSLVVFTSANAVQSFAQRARTLGLQPHPRRIAVIGPATAAAVEACGLLPDDPALLMPPQYIAESLAELLLPMAAGAPILLPRATAARDTLPEALIAAGATVTIAESYQTIIPPSSIAELRTLFATEPPDVITFTSASTAHNLATLLQAAGLSFPSATILASIGPITSQAMREHGFNPDLEAAESTIPALADALETHFAALTNPT